MVRLRTSLRSSFPKKCKKSIFFKFLAWISGTPGSLRLPICRYVDLIGSTYPQSLGLNGPGLHEIALVIQWSKSQKMAIFDTKPTRRTCIRACGPKLSSPKAPVHCNSQKVGVQPMPERARRLDSTHFLTLAEIQRK